MIKIIIEVNVKSPKFIINFLQEFIKVNRKNWLSRQLERMGSDRSSFQSNRFGKSKLPFDMRLQVEGSGRNSPSKSRKSSIYERILNYGQRKCKIKFYLGFTTLYNK